MNIIAMCVVEIPKNCKNLIIHSVFLTINQGGSKKRKTRPNTHLYRLHALLTWPTIRIDPDVIRTRNLLTWSQTRYHCASESTGLFARLYESDAIQR